MFEWNYIDFGRLFSTMRIWDRYVRSTRHLVRTGFHKMHYFPDIFSADIFWYNCNCLLYSTDQLEYSQLSETQKNKKPPGKRAGARRSVLHITEKCIRFVRIVFDSILWYKPKMTKVRIKPNNGYLMRKMKCANYCLLAIGTPLCMLFGRY